MRLAVISDIHGNLPALEKAFAFIDKIKIDGIIWCGDYITDILLSYEVLEFIRLKNEKYKHWIVKGNREDYIIAFGVFAYLTCHMVVNLMGVIGMIPLTGVPLPFLSYGGSSLLVSMIAI